MCLTGQSSDEERAAAKRRLVSGEVRFIFVVDIYNEGVDIPEVNTVLFLRPTESLTIFLQQLGRGLCLSEDKECLTVLDFIGQANRKYNFEDKFAALLSNTTRSVSREIKDGFVSVPKGCYIQLEKKAAKYILENIRASYGNTAGLVARAASFAEDSGLELTLKNFLDYYHLDPRAIYKFSSFSRICARADAIEDFSEPLEDVLTKAFAKLAVIDSRRWISFLLDVLPCLDNLDFAALPDAEKRMMQMFYITVWGKAVEDWDDEEVLSNLYALSDSTVLLGELLELLRYRFEQIDFIDEPVEMGFDCPLDLHCTYTRDQLLVALDFMKPSTVREGVKWLPEKNIDVFFVTLNKADKDYSPTTMYNDYSISEDLFHWQSQKLNKLAPIMEGLENLSAQYSQRPEEWVPEAATFETAKSYREKKAMPLIQKLVKVLFARHRKYWEVKNERDKYLYFYQDEKKATHHLSQRLKEVEAENSQLYAMKHDFGRVWNYFGAEKMQQVIGLMREQEQTTDRSQKKNRQNSVEL